MASNTHINDLSSFDLLLIFKHLPPHTRLLVSEVCLRWYSVSQLAWLDVTHLNLTGAPSRSIGAIIIMCPNLTSLFAKGQFLILDDLKDISPVSFKAMHLQDCEFVSFDHRANRTALPLFRSEYGQSMEELVLEQHDFGVECLLSKRYSQRLLPVSLKRLQLSGLGSDPVFLTYFSYYITEMSKLRNLESLILTLPPDEHFYPGSEELLVRTLSEKLLVRALSSLTNLRELVFPTVDDRVNVHHLLKSVSQLPKLEILFVPKRLSYMNDQFLRSLLSHPTLRILVLPQGFGFTEFAHPFTFNRFPDGFAAKPLLTLHIFYGFGADFVFRKMDGPANRLDLHPLVAPFPQVLEDEEIMSIFGDSWIAKQIKDGVKRGVSLWEYENGLILFGPAPDPTPIDVGLCSCM